MKIFEKQDDDDMTKSRKPKAEAPSASDPVWVVGRQRDVQRFFGVARSTVDLWAREPDFPGGRKGPWDLSQVVQWRDKRRAAEPKSDDARQRKLNAEAEIAERRAAILAVEERERRGELVDAAGCRQAWAIGMLRIKHRILSAPDEMAMSFPQATRQEHVADFRAKIEALLTEMSTWNAIPIESTGDHK